MPTTCVLTPLKLGYNSYYFSVDVILFELFPYIKIVRTDLRSGKFYVNANSVGESTIAFLLLHSTLIFQSCSQKFGLLQ
jgi:hypothetical protein